MKQEIFTITENTKLTETVLRMVLEGNTEGIRAGQFVNIALPGKFLRRPISVCDCEEGKLTIVYKVVGEGTLDLSVMKEGQKLDILTGLGNGYDKTGSGDAPLLCGGGVGVPPLYRLAKDLIKEGKKPVVALGFNTAGEVFYEEEFKALGCKVLVTTVDGSYGIKGYVTYALTEPHTAIFACGPLPMLKALYKESKVPTQFSLEERMGCGFGACMGCTIKTNSGNKRVCKDGPVFTKEDLPW